MFDVDASEFLVVVIVAIIAIGPKDMPAALRAAGRFVGKMRRVSGHFRSGIETMIREAEMEEMEKKWQEQNRKVMEEHPGIEMTAANGGGVDMVPLPPPVEPEPAPEPEPEDAKPAAKKPASGKPAAKKAAPKKPAATKAGR